jgi:hypothetical protein
MRVMFLGLGVLLLGTVILPPFHRNAHPNEICKVGGTCDFVIVNDPASLKTTGSLAGCAPGAVCTFTSDITFSSPSPFGTTNYTCFANQTGTIIYPVVFEFSAQTQGDTKVTFRNETGSTIPGNTTFNIAFTCEGVFNTSPPSRWWPNHVEKQGT